MAPPGRAKLPGRGPLAYLGVGVAMGYWTVTRVYPGGGEPVQADEPLGPASATKEAASSTPEAGAPRRAG